MNPLHIHRASVFRSELVLETLFGILFDPDNPKESGGLQGADVERLILRLAMFVLSECFPGRDGEATPDAVKAVATYGAEVIAGRIASFLRLPTRSLLVQVTTILEMFQNVPGMELVLTRKGIYSSVVDCFWRSIKDPNAPTTQDVASQATLCMRVFCR